VARELSSNPETVSSSPLLKYHHGRERREGCGEREAAGLGIASLPSSEQRDLDRPPVGQDLPIQLQWSLRQRSRSCVEDLAWTCWLATRTWLPPSTTLLGCLFRGCTSHQPHRHQDLLTCLDQESQTGVDPAVSPARTPTPAWRIRAW